MKRTKERKTERRNQIPHTPYPTQKKKKKGKSCAFRRSFRSQFTTSGARVTTPSRSLTCFPAYLPASLPIYLLTCLLAEDLPFLEVRAFLFFLFFWATNSLASAGLHDFRRKHIMLLLLYIACCMLRAVVDCMLYVLCCLLYVLCSVFFLLFLLCVRCCMLHVASLMFQIVCYML